MIKKVLSLFSPPERKQAFKLMMMILVMALFEMLGVVSIFPFIAVLSNPDLIETNDFLNTMFSVSGHIGIETKDRFLFALGLMVFLLLVTSLAFKSLTTFAQVRFTKMREFSIGKRLIEGYLHQPYCWFLSRNSSELGKTIVSEVKTVIDTVVSPLMILIAQSAVLLAILIPLIVIDYKLALSICVTLGLAYAATFLMMRDWIKNLGQARSKANQSRFNSLNEAFGAVKALKLSGVEQKYVERFAQSAQIYAKTQSTTLVISQLPRNIMEAIVFGGMVIVILYLMQSTGGLNEALPIVALYAFAGYRIMPALQQIYVALVSLRFGGASLEALHNDLANLHNSRIQNPPVGLLPFTQSIRLKGIRYRYPNAEHFALNCIDLVVPVGNLVAFVGATGSGKTTTVDLLMGLIEPTDGVLEVDGREINNLNRREWQNGIGYVPQHIYLADDSVAANIAFGVDAKDIDQLAVERAARIAKLHEFVANELPQGYDTTVGERGIRLSGGQRQRIGIARALYNNPQVLILDEATSALDNLTEQALMEAVNDLKQNITIILVAHRISTVRECDQIFLMEKGKLLSNGRYEELLEKSQKFKELTLL